jgi:hypothetical protein
VFEATLAADFVSEQMFLLLLRSCFSFSELFLCDKTFI